MKNDLNEDQLNQEVTVSLPLRAVLRLAEQDAGVTIMSDAARPLRSRYVHGVSQLPAIGARWHDGIYAGLSIDKGQPCALILLPGEKKSCTWQKAMDWAREQDGMLPSRFDALALLENVKGEFAEEAYWTEAPVTHADDAADAWYQNFSNGNQYWTRKGYELRARAVRRVPI